MTLPKVPSHYETIDVAGAVVDIRPLTRAEAARFQKLQAEVEVGDLEIAVIAAATDTPVEEVREWYGATPAWAVEELIMAVKRISRVDEGAQKSG